MKEDSVGLGKDGYKFIAISFLIEMGLISASYLSMQNLFLTLMLIVSILLALSASKYFVFLYMFFVPTNDIFPMENFLFSIIGIKQIIGLSMLVYYQINRKVINNRFKLNNTSDDIKVANLLIGIIYVILLYWFYRNFKNAYFGLHEIDYQKAAIKSLNVFLFLFGLVPFVKIIFSTKDVGYLTTSLFFSVLNMLLFSFLSPYLQLLGFKSIGTETTEFDISGYQRYTGIIPDGDSNTLGVFFVITVCFFLLFAKQYRNWQLVLVLLFSFLIIGLTGSRTAFLTLLLCLFLYYLFNKNKKVKISLIVMVPFVVLFAMPFFDMLIDRLSLANEQLDTKTDSNRIGKWILYMDFFLRNPVTFISGAQNELLIGWGSIYYAAHNVYITMIYFSGIIFPALFIGYQYKILKKANGLNLMKDYLLIYIPFFALTMFVSDLGIFYGFILYSTLFFKLRKRKSKDRLLRYCECT